MKRHIIFQSDSAEMAPRKSQTELLPQKALHSGMAASIIPDGAPRFSHSLEFNPGREQNGETVEVPTALAM
jgi:hypothetical protein